MATKGFTLATTRSYDVIVLDIMLPGRDLAQYFAQLREQHSPCRSSCSRRGALALKRKRLDGLNLGADDYLTKPFSLRLVARLHALLRRASGQQTTLLEYGDITVNLVTREVKRAGHSVELTAREFALLTCLMRSPGRTFTRADLRAGLELSFRSRHETSWMFTCNICAKTRSRGMARRSSRPCAVCGLSHSAGETGQMILNSFPPQDRALDRRVHRAAVDRIERFAVADFPSVQP